LFAGRVIIWAQRLNTVAPEFGPIERSVEMYDQSLSPDDTGAVLVGTDERNERSCAAFSTRFGTLMLDEQVAAALAQAAEMAEVNLRDAKVDPDQIPEILTRSFFPILRQRETAEHRTMSWDDPVSREAHAATILADELDTQSGHVRVVINSASDMRGRVARVHAPNGPYELPLQFSLWEPL
jgi:hypothetical protein